MVTIDATARLAAATARFPVATYIPFFNKVDPFSSRQEVAREGFTWGAIARGILIARFRGYPLLALFVLKYRAVP